MSLRHSGASVVLLSCFVLAIGAIGAIGFPALQAQEDSNSVSVGAQVKAQVEALVKLSPEARRAELQKLSKEERKSLWWELKRQKPLRKGTGLTPRPYTAKAKATGGAATAAKAEPPQRLVGSIQYDDGVITATFGGGAIIGNRFNTATGNPVLTSGTVSTVVAVVVQGAAFTSSSAGFVIEGPQTGGGGAIAIFSTFTGGLTATTETVTFSGFGANYTGNSFMVLFGDFANSYVPAFGSGSTQSQGFHGLVGYTGGMGPNITGTFDFGGTLNGLVRVTGNVLPVELMSFDVE